MKKKFNLKMKFETEGDVEVEASSRMEAMMIARKSILGKVSIECYDKGEIKDLYVPTRLNMRIKEIKQSKEKEQ